MGLQTAFEVVNPAVCIYVPCCLLGLISVAMIACMHLYKFTLF